MVKDKKVIKSKIMESVESTTKKAKKVMKKAMRKMKKNKGDAKPVDATIEDGHVEKIEENSGEKYGKLPVLEDVNHKSAKNQIELSGESDDENINVLQTPISDTVTSKKMKKKKSKKSDKSENSMIVEVGNDKETAAAVEEEIIKIESFKPGKRTFEKREENKPQGDEETNARVHIVNISPRSDEQSVRKFFQDNDLNVVDVFLPQSSRNQRFAFVEFDTSEAAQQAIALSGSTIDTTVVTITQAKPRNKRQFNERPSDGATESSTLMVRNLRDQLNDETKLWEMFEGAKDVRVPKDQDGQPRGSCFVEFHDEETAKEMKDKLSAQNMRVDFAQARGAFNFGQRGNFDGNSRGRSSYRGDHSNGNDRFNDRKGFNFSRGGSSRGRGGQGRGSGQGRGGGQPRYFNNQGFNKRPQFDGPSGKKMQFNNDD